METTLEWYSKDKATLSTDDKALIRKLLKFDEERHELNIRFLPEDNDGCLYADIPLSWIHIRPPRTMSETQKELAVKRLLESRGIAYEKKSDS